MHIWVHEGNLPKFLLSLHDDHPGFLAGKSTDMPQKLMDVLKLGRCSHEFSWPRRADDGDYYQVCLLCAVEYKYDWKTMRRTERLERSEASRPKRRSHSQKPTWVPRARRLKLNS